MILVDMNQVMISNLMAQIGSHHNVEVQEDLVRHMVLNSLRGYRNKFAGDYGELVICCDDKNYWRKRIFPYYKANRKKYRSQSELDWSSIFNCLNAIRDELKEHFPYKVMQIDTCEADDIIATICHQEGSHLLNGSEMILILSGDKDFIQLHDGAEFLHRVFWDNDIRHEYHLVRWADHVGLSMYDRTKEAHAFLAASLAGGKSEPIDLELTQEELDFAQSVFGGKEIDTEPTAMMREDPRKAPTIHAELWKPLKVLAKDDPDMQRAYGILPDTQIEEEK